MPPVIHSLDLIHVLKRHKKKVALTCLLVMAGVGLYATVAPRRYTSEAKLLVRLGRETVMLDPTATTGEMINIQETRETEINAVQELLQSRIVFEHVVDALGPDAVLTAADSAQTASVGDVAEDVATSREQAIRAIENRLDVKTVKGSHVVAVSYQDRSPRQAQRILAELVERARTLYGEINRTQGSHEFFEQQAGELKDRLYALEEELRTYKDENGVAELAQQRKIHLTRLGELEDTLLQTESKLQSLETEVAVRRKTVDATPEEVVLESTTGMPNTAIDGMREQLYTLQLREQELSSRLTDKWPTVRQVRRQVAQAREELDREESRIQVKKGVNETRQILESSLLEKEAVLAALQTQREATQGQIADAQKTLSVLNESELKIARLERQIELETANYSKYAENLEQARIDTALASENITSLNLLQPPSLSPRASSPRLALCLAIGAVLSGLCGLAVGLVAELRSPSVLDTGRSSVSAAAYPHRLSDLVLQPAGPTGANGHVYASSASK